MEDREIIRLFLLRSENAISELSQKYGGLCMKLAFNILGDRETRKSASMMPIWRYGILFPVTIPTILSLL